jgi:hypothetical protein
MRRACRRAPEKAPLPGRSRCNKFPLAFKRAPAFMNAVNNFTLSRLHLRGFIFNHNFTVSFTMQQFFNVPYKFFFSRFAVIAFTSVKKYP